MEPLGVRIRRSAAARRCSSASGAPLADSARAASARGAGSPTAPNAPPPRGALLVGWRRPLERRREPGTAGPAPSRPPPGPSGQPPRNASRAAGASRTPMTRIVRGALLPPRARRLPPRRPPPARRQLSESRRRRRAGRAATARGWRARGVSRAEPRQLGGEDEARRATKVVRCRSADTRTVAGRRGAPPEQDIRRNPARHAAPRRPRRTLPSRRPGSAPSLAPTPTPGAPRLPRTHRLDVRAVGEDRQVLERRARRSAASGGAPSSTRWGLPMLTAVPRPVHARDRRVDERPPPVPRGRWGASSRAGPSSIHLHHLAARAPRHAGSAGAGLHLERVRDGRRGPGGACHAAQPVAAHLGDAAVGVVHHHPRRGAPEGRSTRTPSAPMPRRRSQMRREV